MRIGIVSYANALPLSFGLTRHLPGARPVSAEPSVLADALAAGELDLALVPVAALARHPHWPVVPGLGIASRGPVRSVVVTGGVPQPGGILVKDPASRTSNVLAALWTAQHTGKPVVLVEEAPGDQPVPRVVIGDRALFLPPSTPRVDLGEAWSDWTGLPFVYAVWAGPAAASTAVVDGLTACHQANEGREADLAARVGRSEEETEILTSYLRRHIRYRLQASDTRGLNLFFAKAAEAGLLPERRRGEQHVHVG